MTSTTTQAPTQQDPSARISYINESKLAAPLGLRDRKRIETLCAIEDHATRLTLERGYHSVTVDDICQAAQISKRTFFNYVDSKETAVLGANSLLITDSLREELLRAAPADLLRECLRVLCQDVFSSVGINPDFQVMLLRRRKQIMQQLPELMAAHLSMLIHRFRTFAVLVEEYLDAHPEARRLPVSYTSKHVAEATTHPRVSEEAVAISLLLQDCIHVGISRWLSLPERQATSQKMLACTLEALDTLRQVLDRG